MTAVVIFVTCPDARTAETIARSLVDLRLAACGNVAGPLTSIYRWKGEVHGESEVLLILKTRRSRVESCTRAIKALHPYEIPEIIAVPIVGGFGPYLEWIDAETRGGPSSTRALRKAARR